MISPKLVKTGRDIALPSEFCTEGADPFFVLNRVVSCVVILPRFRVDLQGLSHNTDARNTAELLHDVVTPPSNQPRGVQHNETH
jgi:hypothetical protein